MLRDRLCPNRRYGPITATRYAFPRPIAVSGITVYDPVGGGRQSWGFKFRQFRCVFFFLFFFFLFLFPLLCPSYCLGGRSGQSDRTFWHFCPTFEHGLAFSCPNVNKQPTHQTKCYYFNNSARCCAFTINVPTFSPFPLSHGSPTHHLGVKQRQLSSAARVDGCQPA